MKAVYPHHLAKKVVARYIEMNKGRKPNSAVKVHSVHTECGKLVNIQFEEVAPKKVSERMAEFMKAMMKYDDIEGFEYEIKATFEAEEALKLIQ